MRGLDAEAIDVDQPDYEALIALKQWQVTSDQADKFAEEGLLEGRSLAALARPANDSSEPEPESRMSRGSERSDTPRVRKTKRVEASDDDW